MPDAHPRCDTHHHSFCLSEIHQLNLMYEAVDPTYKQEAEVKTDTINKDPNVLAKSRTDRTNIHLKSIQLLKHIPK